MYQVYPPLYDVIVHTTNLASRSFADAYLSCFDPESLETQVAFTLAFYRINSKNVTTWNVLTVRSYYTYVQAILYLQTRLIQTKFFFVTEEENRIERQLQWNTGRIVPLLKSASAGLFDENFDDLVVVHVQLQERDKCLLAKMTKQLSVCLPNLESRFRRSIVHRSENASLSCASSKRKTSVYPLERKVTCLGSQRITVRCYHRRSSCPLQAQTISQLRSYHPSAVIS